MSAAPQILLYLLAALAEIGGCFAFWAWVRLGRSAWWLMPGIMLLVIFAWLLTQIDAGFAGRAYAAYGGVYIAASIGWLWLIEGQVPTRFDLIGGGLCLIGMMVILIGAKG